MLLLVLLLPLLGFLGGSLFGRFLGKGTIFFTTFNVLLSYLFALVLLSSNIIKSQLSILIIAPWITCNSLEISWEILSDNLTLTMILIVTFISLLVHIYASEYMQSDPHIIRFMSYLSLFTFFMLILVTGANFLQLFVGWEGVGLSSYLLINFWYTRIQANKAAIKAMLFNRVADMFLLLALFLIYLTFKTFDFLIIFSMVPFVLKSSINLYFFNLTNIDLICFFLFLGAMGKSAQLGFHNWLPDAMEGPTPVSALIHAATMVTAGIFLLIRCSYLFEFSPVVLNFIALIGALTALFGATTGLFFHDLKRVVAFSTCSQLGYMMLACGLERFNAAFFHLATHAFFKALLFLAAGAIIHSLSDEQDTRKFGGLLYYLPITYICFLIGSLNLIGTPFLSGFFSKDLILELAIITYSNIGLFSYTLGIFSIFFTSAYSTRLILLIFFVSTNFSKHTTTSVIESSWSIKIPLILLSFISIFFGSVFLDIFCGLGTNFFTISIFYNLYNQADIEFLDSFFKLLPLYITFLGFFVSTLFYFLIPKLLLKLKKLQLFKYIFYFFIKKWYTDRIINQLISINVLYFGHDYTYKSLDRGLFEILGPSTVSKQTNKLLFSSKNLALILPKFFF
jgi:NADH-ubiquinone oxidoreductase chain 5